MQGYTRRLTVALVLTLGSGCDDGEGGRGQGRPLGEGKADCTAVGCEDEGVPTGPLADAFCDIEVIGEGSVPTETEYLANVIYCENGGADFESLKAMAIAARSVAYWEMGVNGEICDSDHCQVFTCDGEPSEIHRRAVEETSGMYLFWGDQVTYGFYVRGSEVGGGPLCEPLEEEEYVTYNLGRSGEAVEQTDLGWISEPSDGWYGQNRGCMSQLGMRCLASELEYDYVDILRYYYGADIQIGQAQGECVLQIDPDPEPPPEPEPEDDGEASDTDDGADTDSGSDTDEGSDTEADAGSDDRPPRPESGSASAGDTDGASDTDVGSDTDTDGSSDTDGDADTEASDGDTEAPADTEGDDEDDDYDPWGTDDGGGWPDDDYDPDAPSPWGDDDGGSDTDTDGADVDSEGSGCSVSGAGDRERPALALGLLLLGMLRRRKG